MDADLQHALAEDRVIDITTTGRKSGQPRRIEIWFHNLDGRLFITGTPGRRSWYANLLAHPDFTFHVKRSAQADLPARARAVTQPDERREVLQTILSNIDVSGSLDEWVEGARLLEVELLDAPS